MGGVRAHVVALLGSAGLRSFVSPRQSLWAGVCVPPRAREGTFNHRISYVVMVTLSHFCTSVNFLY